MTSSAMHKKATVALNETARARLWWGLFGGETSPCALSSYMAAARDDDDEEDELVDLVHSFYEGNEDGTDVDAADEDDVTWRPGWKEMLDATLAEASVDDVAQRIRVEAERAVRDIASGCGDGFKKRVVNRLREKGFDAGFCTSSWDKARAIPMGSHEYIDVITRGTARYIMEINPAFEFEIARPSSEYLELLHSLPVVLVARPEVFKAIAMVMCTAASESIRGAGMHVPPWRRLEYMQAKWSSPYKRMSGGTRMEREEGGRAAAGVVRSGVPSGRKFCRMEMGYRERLGQVDRGL